MPMKLRLLGEEVYRDDVTVGLLYKQRDFIPAIWQMLCAGIFWGLVVVWTVKALWRGLELR